MLSHLLGGKLVAMLMASPEVRDEYKRRYSGTPSIIASSMAGRQVKRPAELVFISTTSLYGKRPNQYDRITLPGRLWGKAEEERRAESEKRKDRRLEIGDLRSEISGFENRSHRGGASAECRGDLRSEISGSENRSHRGGASDQYRGDLRSEISGSENRKGGCSEAMGDGEVRWRYLGGTQGKGTYQFNTDTMEATENMLNRMGKRRVNHIFGEGANPRMRAVRDGLDTLKLPSDAFLSHGTPRLVYVMGLVSNLAEYLLGMEKRCKWLVETPEGKTAEDVTRAIAGYWRERWMMRRVVDEEVMGKVRGETAVYPVTHGARVRLPRALDDQMEMWEE